jgi:hypothetical protein
MQNEACKSLSPSMYLLYYAYVLTTSHMNSYVHYTGVATWGNSSPSTDWNKAAERIASAALAGYPGYNKLIFVEGVQQLYVSCDISIATMLLRTSCSFSTVLKACERTTHTSACVLLLLQ